MSTIKVEDYRTEPKNAKKLTNILGSNKITMSTKFNKAKKHNQ